jgi:predicted nuclease of restriction endonuclease-like RecB superfamily
MLTGKQVRVRFARNKLVPQYLDGHSDHWLGVAEQLLLVFRDSPGRTRGELTEALADLVGDGPTQLVHQGFAKLLEDRCEFEVASDIAPEQIREHVFKASAEYRAEAIKAGKPFDRTAVLEQVATEMAITPEQVDVGLFADLKDEQKVIKFDDTTAEWLVRRYNVALAQAVLLRCTEMEVKVWGETPARFRQLFRAVKFHRLICTIRNDGGNGYSLRLDGPLSLFSSTQKYGLQLALFLPALLHCRAFDLKATVRWGADRKEKQFTLSGTDGLQSHLPDFGMYVPREVTMFEDNFKNGVSDWLISSDPMPMPVDGMTWVPDFKLTHTPTGKEVFVEMIGFWRKVNLADHYKRLKRGLPGQFVLAVGEANRADEEDEFALGEGVYRYKRTPIAAEVAKAAALAAGV